LTADELLKDAATICKRLKARSVGGIGLKLSHLHASVQTVARRWMIKVPSTEGAGAPAGHTSHIIPTLG